MDKTDVLLINPYWSQLSEGIEHLGLGYMASELRQNGYTAVILDAPVNRWDNARTIEEARKFSPLLIGVSIPFQDGAGDAFDLIVKLRENFSCHICVGGIYPTFEYEAILNDYPQIDSISLGEGEETIVDLTSALKYGKPVKEVPGIALKERGRIIKTDIRPLIEDLDSIPLPARDTLPTVIKNFNFASIVSSRGCYGRCSFCSVDGFYAAFGPKYRARSAKNVVDEMEGLYRKYNVRNFMINDANFIGGITNGRKRAFEIAKEIMDRGMRIEFRIQCRANDVDRDLFKVLKQAGLTRVYLGIESGSQPQLDRYQKDITVEQNWRALSILNELELFVKIGFIMFDKDATIDDLLSNITFIKKLKSMYNKDRLGSIYPISRVIPLSGSKIKDDLGRNGRLKGNYRNYSYDFTDSRVNMFYNLMQKSSKSIWGLKSRFKGNEEDTRDWTKGWKEWNEASER